MRLDSSGRLSEARFMAVDYAGGLHDEVQLARRLLDGIAEELLKRAETPPEGKSPIRL
jgi:hypothetical protein